jgi:prepilin-type N-terminal cleavage/methylation domain-containing protein
LFGSQLWGCGMVPPLPIPVTGSSRRGAHRVGFTLLELLVAMGVIAVLVALIVVNAGYLFQGSLTPLGEFDFLSKAFTGNPDTSPLIRVPGNRFQQTWLAAVPVPFPGPLVQGLDLQSRDFENSKPLYLGGRAALAVASLAFSGRSRNPARLVVTTPVTGRRFNPKRRGLGWATGRPGLDGLADRGHKGVVRIVGPRSSAPAIGSCKCLSPGDRAPALLGFLAHALRRLLSDTFGGKNHSSSDVLIDWHLSSG